ncbi:hypothetical protein BKA80DRAFT_48039 [Phyllosticta citrichinensis]
MVRFVLRSLSDSMRTGGGRDRGQRATVTWDKQRSKRCRAARGEQVTSDSCERRPCNVGCVVVDHLPLHLTRRRICRRVAQSSSPRSPGSDNASTALSSAPQRLVRVAARGGLPAALVGLLVEAFAGAQNCNSSGAYPPCRDSTSHSVISERLFGIASGKDLACLPTGSI